jgi:hypothetical protein|tara:strand:- start:5263 stop:5457 length:195 start_codon:yes stop_codon:yes gene_type:complete
LKEATFSECPQTNTEKPAMDKIPAGQTSKGAIEKGKRAPNRINMRQTLVSYLLEKELKIDISLV